MQKLNSSKEIRVLIWAIIWVLALMGTLEIMLHHGWPWKITELEAYVLRKKNDDWTHNAFAMQKIKKSVNNANDMFVFLGGSISLEAISTDKFLSDRLSKLRGVKSAFVSLCASYQTPADNAKITQSLGSFAGTLMIGIEPLTFKVRKENQLVRKLKSGRIHLKYYYLPVSQGVDNILSDYGYDVDWRHQFYIFRASEVFGEILKKKALAFLKSKGAFKRIPYSRHTASYVWPGRKAKPPVTEEDRIKQSKWIAKLLKRYRSEYKLNRDLLRETIKIAQSNGNDVVLVDLPDNPIYKDEISEFSPHYDDMIKNLLLESGAGYIDLRKAADWLPEDFRDVHHMRDPGREKLTEALAVNLSEYLSQKSNLEREL